MLDTSNAPRFVFRQNADNPKKIWEIEAHTRMPNDGCKKISTRGETRVLEISIIICGVEARGAQLRTTLKRHCAGSFFENDSLSSYQDHVEHFSTAKRPAAIDLD